MIRVEHWVVARTVDSPVKVVRVVTVDWVDCSSVTLLRSASDYLFLLEVLVILYLWPQVALDTSSIATPSYKSASYLHSKGCGKLTSCAFALFLLRNFLWAMTFCCLLLFISLLPPLL